VVSHTYNTAGTKTAALTVNYADGDSATKSVTALDVAAPLFTNVSQDVGATVPMVLSLTLGAPATFGTFTPSIVRDYTASTTATALATSGDALLTVADPAAGTTGHLVNGDYTLPSALQVKATSAIGTSGAAFADIGGTAGPTSLLTYTRALNDAAITLDFKQHVGQTDALRAGKYSKTLTFTLSTTTP
jgi:hypothetical protein